MRLAGSLPRRQRDDLSRFAERALGPLHAFHAAIRPHHQPEASLPGPEGDVEDSVLDPEVAPPFDVDRLAAFSPLFHVPPVGFLFAQRAHVAVAKRPLQSHQRATTRHKPAPLARSTVAALFVEKDGAYYGLDDVDPWDIERDARKYAGPHPVVAHPPCERWGRFWHGSTRKPHQYKLGDDGGCFAAALSAVRRFGGVLEHPADSHAWSRFNLNRPTRGDGWLAADMFGGWTCYVEQGHYGHFARKPTWLYAVGASLPELNWSRGEQRLHPTALERHGYAKARRIGMMAMVGGKDKKRIRDATPPEFRDLLLSIARSAARSETRTT